MELLPASDYWDVIASSVETPLLGLVYRLPPRLQRQIGSIQNELVALDKRQLYSPLSTLHISVKVFGLLGKGVDTKAQGMIISKTREVISEFSPFELNFRGLGFFPSCVYVKVEDPSDQLRMINKRLLSELEGLVEKSKYDGDLFIPHVTVATFNTREATSIISKISSQEMKNVDIGRTEVFELEAVEVKMFLLFGPPETQEQGMINIRSFHLTGRVS